MPCYFLLQTNETLPNLQSMSEDKLREEVVQLNADKENYQEAAKEALRKSLTDKIEVIKKCQDLERLDESSHSRMSHRIRKLYFYLITPGL